MPSRSVEAGRWHELVGQSAALAEPRRKGSLGTRSQAVPRWLRRGWDKLHAEITLRAAIEEVGPAGPRRGPGPARRACRGADHDDHGDWRAATCSRGGGFSGGPSTSSESARAGAYDLAYFTTQSLDRLTTPR